MKRLVPVYKPSDKVPRKYQNLRKPQHVTSFKHPYRTVPDILHRDYGVDWNEKIIVYYMKEISLPHFNRYRTKFRKVFSGPLKELGQYLRQFRKRDG